MDYQDKKVVIVGLGVTGLSCVDYFLSRGVIPRLMDTRHTPPWADKLDNRVKYHFGGFRCDWLHGADIIVMSPGVTLSAQLLAQAEANGTEIIGDIELFCREMEKKCGKRLVAITGTNGKTTVTTLVGDIAKAAGIRTAVGGNIGVPVLSLLSSDDELYVLELSSFQLETTYSLQANVATILNISDDHMSRYPAGIADYIAAKQRVYHRANYCVVNHDDSLLLPAKGECDRCIAFGLSQAAYSLDSNYRQLVVNGTPVLATAEIKLIGLHNYVNVLAALAIVDRLGIDRQISLSVIKQFSGLPHRFECVHERHGVCWINDSKATNVGSTKAALKSVVCHGQLYLLLGGEGKKADFLPLLTDLQRDRLTIYAFGKDANVLAKLRPEITTKVNTMADAVAHIAQKLKPGDVVLLSPACASLDQFSNYMERGEAFTQLARQWGA